MIKVNGKLVYSDYKDPNTIKHGYMVKVATHYPVYDMNYASMTPKEAENVARHLNRLIENGTVDDYIIESM